MQPNFGFFEEDSLGEVRDAQLWRRGGGYLYAGGKNDNRAKTASWGQPVKAGYESRPPCYSALGPDPFGAFFSIKRKLGDWT